MDPVVQRLYQQVSDLMSESDFQAEIDRLRDAYANLLDDEALALHILDEKNRNEGSVVTLDEVRGRAEATVRVHVEAIESIREFQRKDGRTGRVANVLIRDATGEARLVLWDRDVDQAEDGTLKAGAHVKVINARVKDSRWGLELHAGPWSVLEVEGAPDPAKKKLLTDTLADTKHAPWGPAKDDAEDEPTGEEPRRGGYLDEIQLRLTELEPTRPFRRHDGTMGFVANAHVQDPSGNEGLLVLWDDNVLAARNLHPGDTFTITNLSVRGNEDEPELHTTKKSKLNKTAPPTGEAL